MGLNGECKNDNDCPYKQFCYNVSGRCVATLNCSNYNRQDSQIAAREPSQCGPCMKGYTSEILASGDEMPLCKYTDNQVGSNAMSDVNKIIVIIVVVGAIVSIPMCNYLYKRYCPNRRRSSRSNNADIAPEVAPDNANAIAVASVPPEEEKPFIGFGQTKYCVPHNNNEGIKETNQYQTTVPFTHRHINVYAATNNNTDNNNSNSNNNPLSREVAINVPEDQHYRNIETSQIDPVNDELPNHNDADGDTIDSASEPTNKGEKIKSSLIINQMVHQNITINMNGEEYL